MFCQLKSQFLRNRNPAFTVFFDLHERFNFQRKLGPEGKPHEGGASCFPQVQLQLPGTMIFVIRRLKPQL